jgi:hypothetical protein
VSFQSGTQAEVMYAVASQSTELATFTAEDNLQKTYPPWTGIQPGFFTRATPYATCLKIKASGQIGGTTTPTFLFSLRLLTSTTWSAGGVLAGATAAQAISGTLVRCPWFADIDVLVRSPGLGANTTVVTTGEIRSPIFTLPVTIPSLAVSPAVATLDSSSTYYPFLSVACGTSNSLNLINMQTLKVYGEN